MGKDIIVRSILDVTVCTHSKGGVGRWVRGLESGLSQVNRDHLSIDLAETHPGHTSTVPGATVIPPPLWMKLPLFRRLLLGRGILETSRASRIEKLVGKPDIIHLSGVQPEGNGRNKVVTFFDDTPWVSPESHTKETLFYAGKLKCLVDSGAAVLAISGWAASIARNLFNIPPERTGYAGGAAEDIFTPGEPNLQVLEKLDLEPGGYFLHVGSYVPRKNIPFLVRCFKEAGTEKKLVLAGAEKWGDGVAENTSGVVFLKNISDNDLLTLYRGAVALLLPSTSEGLGLPVLEAFACGTPVIASDGGALPETVGRNGLLLPVLKSEPWVRSIVEMATGVISSSLRKQAESALRPTWKDVGEKAMNFYRSLL
ncbi:MAG: glycosyltransferase family 4 protein [Candidatus Sabulitectum sp.]|nr:glycosyltransferase family 4 protein [Candidatus Sabulitectum sp.]